MNTTPRDRAEAEAFRRARRYVAKWLPIRSREAVEKGLYRNFCMILTDDDDVRWCYKRK